MCRLNSFSHNTKTSAVMAPRRPTIQVFCAGGRIGERTTALGAVVATGALAFPPTGTVKLPVARARTAPARATVTSNVAVLP